MDSSNPISVNRFVLDNGLTVIHSYDGSTAMAAVNVLYNVGSRDESRKLTGMAHLFEHLMFGGSANIPSFDGELERAGGKSNAWTSDDFTNFYDILPAQNIATAFHLESDRMLALDFSEASLEVQRGVVIEEFKQTCLDRPYGDMMHHLRRLVYAADHPYSWPVIGLEPDHIARVDMDDVRRWFYSHYAPDNAILSVTGRVTLDEVRELAEKWFSGIPRRNIKARKLPSPGFPESDVSETVYGNAPLPDIVVAYPMDCYGTPGYFAADTVTDLLAA
ncbi:MAG: insulinase family protein, partial [Muribaculaceae bacterium]|nr:insulinase family protein [Muribaculaceae bacterium]